MGRGRRYSGDEKLNIKKVFAVIIAIVVIVMFVFVIKMLLTKDKGEKVTSETYFVSYLDKKYGVINAKGENVITPSYAEYIVIPNSKKDVFVCTYDVNYTDGTYHTKVLNSKNEEILTGFEQVQALDNFDSQNNISYFDSMVKVKKDGKFGTVDLTGKQIIPCEYDDIRTLKGVKDVLVVIKDGKQGIADIHGKVTISLDYKEIKPWGEGNKTGYIVANAEGKWGIVDQNNKVILDTIYEEIKPIFAEEKYVVKEAGKWKVIDNNTTLETGFTDVKDIQGNAIIVQSKDKYGVVTIEGTQILPAEYQDVSFAFIDTFIVKQNEKYGLVKSDKQVLLETKYDTMQYSKQANLIEASEDGIQTDIIGSDYAVKVSGIVSEMNLEKGYFRIRVGEDYKYYNFKFEEKKATEVLANNTLFLAKQDGKYGYTDKDGKVVVKCEYDDATEQNVYGYAAVKKDGKWGSMDKNGKVLLAPEYALENNMKIDFIANWHIGQDLNMNYYTK